MPIPGGSQRLQGVGGGSSGGSPGAARPSRLWRYARGEEDGAGTIVASLGFVPSGKVWYLEHMNVFAASTTDTKFAVYENLVDETTRRTRALAGNDNDGDFAAPVFIAGDSEILCVWTGASAGAVATANVQVREEDA